MRDTEKRLQLAKICQACGRSVQYGKDGKIYTFRPYDPTDTYTFTDIEQAIEWERGYIPTAKEVQK